MLPVYVIANGDLVKATFDAIAIVLNSETFNTAIKLATTFAVLGVGFSYIRGRDLAVFFKWFIFYFLVTVILLGPKKDLQIIDSSNPMAVYKVDNLPLGLALPASFITRTAHGLMLALEDAYHLPDEFTYNKTGMLFGSRLFKLSTGFHFSSPQLMHEFNHYVKNCVLGDILINKKYSLDELKNSNELLTLIMSDPSPRRGVIFGEGFKTCKEAAPLLKEQIKQDVEKQSTILGLRVFGGQSEFEVTTKLKTALANTYQYYAGVSNSALQIMTQNILINGLREGILNYASETQASAAFLNLSTTQAMERMRLSWATSRNMAAYVLPVMHTDILLMLFCLFPIIVMLSIQPQVGPRVLKNYFYSILWVESWPILFACLNLTVSFYAQGKTSAGGLTLSNIDLLALEHSDIANLAGYLMLTIPFIAIGLVTGMAQAFSSAAAYIGGVLQSSAIQASSEAASGNISLGIASWGNVNANKFDTNSTLMRGHTTEQLASGVLKTITADGSEVIDASRTISQLPIGLNLAKGVSTDLAKQASRELQATEDNRIGFNQSLSNAEANLRSFDRSSDLVKSIGDSHITDETATAAKHLGKINSVVDDISHHYNVSREAALQVARSFAYGSQFSAGLEASASGSVSTPGKSLFGAGLSAGLVGKIAANIYSSFETNKSTITSEKYLDSGSMDSRNHLAQDLRGSFDYAKSFSTKHHADLNQSEVARLATNVSSSLAQADHYEKGYHAHQSESQRLGEMASYVEHNAAQINANYSQPFMSWLQAQVSEEKFNTMVAGKTIEDIQTMQNYASEYLANTGVTSQLNSGYEHVRDGVNPGAIYSTASEKVDAMGYNIKNAHQVQGEQLAVQAKESWVEFPQQNFNNINQEAAKQQTAISSNIDNAMTDADSQRKKASDAVSKQLTAAHKSTTTSKAGDLSEDKLKPISQ